LPHAPRTSLGISTREAARAGGRQGARIAALEPGEIGTYTPQQLVTVAKRHGCDLSHLLDANAQVRGRASRITTQTWVDQPSKPQPSVARQPGAYRRRPREDAETEQSPMEREYPPDLAVRWHLGGDWSATLPLWWKLQRHAGARFERHGELRRRALDDWRWCVLYSDQAARQQPLFVTGEVARIVLGEQGPTAPLFAAAPMLRCWLLGITPEQWNRHAPRAHAVLTEAFERWLEQGIEQVRAWVLDDGRRPTRGVGGLSRNTLLSRNRGAQTHASARIKIPEAAGA
jgi:hypothetical protein